MVQESDRRVRIALEVSRMRHKLLPATAAAIVAAGALLAQSSPQPAAPVANLNEIMRGLFFPHSNVVFFTQTHNPAEVKKHPEPSTSTDPLTGVFGNWEAVENSALILSEAADFLLTPGRKCSNDREMPLGDADWIKFAKEEREGAMVAYKAALTKNQDEMLKAADVLNMSCQDCHNRYRARTRCEESAPGRGRGKQ